MRRFIVCLICLIGVLLPSKVFSSSDLAKFGELINSNNNFASEQKRLTSKGYKISGISAVRCEDNIFQTLFICSKVRVDYIKKNIIKSMKFRVEESVIKDIVIRDYKIDKPRNCVLNEFEQLISTIIESKGFKSNEGNLISDKYEIARLDINSCESTNLKDTFVNSDIYYRVLKKAKGASDWTSKAMVIRIKSFVNAKGDLINSSSKVEEIGLMYLLGN